MATTLTYRDAKKEELVVVLAEDYVFPADEDEMDALAAALDEKGQANLTAWQAQGTTTFKAPLKLVSISDDEPEPEEA